MRKITLTLLLAVAGLLITVNAFGNTSDTTNVIMITKKGLEDKTLINEFYHPNGIKLLTNGIYHFKINGKKYDFYRIVRIWDDSLSIAWTLDNEPTIGVSISEIDKVTFPSLDNGVTGFPHPTMKQGKYEFEMVNEPKVKLPTAKICEDKECQSFLMGYMFMTSGYGWKPIYLDNGIVKMIDKTVVHILERK